MALAFTRWAGRRSGRQSARSVAHSRSRPSNRARRGRREVDRAIAERRLDAPERYAHLQVARLSKALRVADGSIEQDDLKAVGPFLRLNAALDRYHGLAPQRAARAPAEAPPLALPAPPLALTHAAPVPQAEAPLALEAMEDGSAA
jgi:hypothetical protein